MARQNSVVLSLPAGNTVAPYRIVRGGANSRAFQASNATGPFLGISTDTTAEVGDTVAFVPPGNLATVQAGGTITVTNAGVPCTSDGNGRAVPAAAGNDVACIVLESAVLDQLVRCLVVSYRMGGN